MTRIYHLDDYFKDIGVPQGYDQYKSYDKHFHPVLGPMHPGVDTHVLYRFDNPRVLCILM